MPDAQERKKAKKIVTFKEPSPEKQEDFFTKTMSSTIVKVESEASSNPLAILFKAIKAKQEMLNPSSIKTAEAKTAEDKLYDPNAIKVLVEPPSKPTFYGKESRLQDILYKQD